VGVMLTPAFADEVVPLKTPRREGDPIEFADD
jgi:hypothetical protein